MTAQGKGELERLLRRYLGLTEGTPLPTATSLVSEILAHEYPANLNGLRSYHEA